MSNQIRAKFRSWVTPITVFVFLFLAGSGLLMDLDHRGMRGLHEMFGYAFCFISVLHIALNWRPLLSHLKTTKALVTIAIVAVLASLIWISAINDKGHNGRSWETRGEYSAHGD